MSRLTALLENDQYKEDKGTILGKGENGQNWGSKP